MNPDEARERIRAAIAELVRLGGGTPSGCRAVVRPAPDADRWQDWFRAATGLPVLVSTETVFLISDRRAVAKVDLPPVLRDAVRELSDGRAAQGGTERRRVSDVPVGATVLVACPECGVPRPVKNVSGNLPRAQRGKCRECARSQRRSA